MMILEEQARGQPYPEPLYILYATRFGTTERLARIIGDEVRGRGIPVELLKVSALTPVPEQGSFLLMTAIIWDLPLKEMRRFLAQHREHLAPRLLGIGVVCGSQGVRKEGGKGYLRALRRHFPASPPLLFALSGAIPPRERLKPWEYALLRLFSILMRKPQLFTIAADEEGAREVGKRVIPYLLHPAPSSSPTPEPSP